MKLAFVGCGYIGDKRSKQVGEHQVVGFYDTDFSKAEKLAQEVGAIAYQTIEELLSKSGADIVVIATINSALAPMALKAVAAGKHVLVEKPAAITNKEIKQLKALAKKKKVIVKVGFNHRFHPALLKTRELIDEGKLGKLMFLRARYGHGARLGYEKEWRNIPKTGGGGELLDQGVHLLDLIYWLLGPLPLQTSFVTTSFWKMKVDDNAVLTVADKKKNMWATLHVTCTEWKNTFALELYGKTGKILIQGLGKSYGKETLTYYKMLPQMGPPLIENFEFDEVDRSWELDLKNLVDHIQDRKKPLWGDLESAAYALEQVFKAYKANGFKNLPGSKG